RRILRRATSEVEFKFGGLSVTMPHKQTIIRYLDEIDETSRSIGAVNTVKVEEGKLIGYNTDALGFITPLKKDYDDLKGARVAIFGAGGAARACIYALKNARAAVTLFARNPVKVRSLADEFAIGLERIKRTKTEKPTARFADFDVLVNATPYGMGDLASETLFTAEELAGLKFVYDLVTKPYDTPIIREARLAGIPTISGLEMLIAQGVEQFRIWTGEDVSEDEMRANIMRLLAQ
ncbi:MAG: shikimate dehydrogenase, partial [Acidobacteriota bacterium]